MARKVHRNTSLGLPHHMKLLYERNMQKTCLRVVPVFWVLPSFNFCYSNLIHQCMELYLTSHLPHHHMYIQNFLQNYFR